LNARYLSGGIDGWAKAGRPVQPKTDGIGVRDEHKPAS
jgi:hypothetical protein